MKNYFSISVVGEKINSTNLVLFKFFRRKLRLQFWQPCQEASNKSQNASPQCPKIWKIRRGKVFPDSSILWTRGFQFWQTYHTFSTRGRKDFAQCPKMIRERRNIEKWLFPQILPHDMWNAVFANPPTSFHQQTGSFPLKVRSWREKIFQKLSFPQVLPLKT